MPCTPPGRHCKYRWGINTNTQRSLHFPPREAHNIHEYVHIFVGVFFALHRIFLVVLCPDHPLSPTSRNANSQGCLVSPASTPAILPYIGNSNTEGPMETNLSWKPLEKEEPNDRCGTYTLVHLTPWGRRQYQAKPGRAKWS